MKGWLKLYRKLLESSVWKNSTASHKAVLITILMKANHGECDWWDNSAGKNIVLKPGSFTTSNRQLAEDAEVSVKAVRNALERLEKQNFITSRAHRTFTLITIKNWNLYQPKQDEGHAKETQRSTRKKREGVHEGVHKEEVRSQEVKKEENNTPPTREGKKLPADIEQKAFNLFKHASSLLDEWVSLYPPDWIRYALSEYQNNGADHPNYVTRILQSCAKKGGMPDKKKKQIIKQSRPTAPPPGYENKLGAWKQTTAGWIYELADNYKIHVTPDGKEMQI